MTGHRILPLAFLPVVWLSLSHPLHADEQEKADSLPMTWQVAPECDSAADIIEGTKKILNNGAASSAFHSTAKQLRGEVSRIDSNWRVHLVIRDGEQTWERMLEVHTCRGAMDVAILLSALAMDSQKVLQSPDPSLQPQLDRLGQLPLSADETAEENHSQGLHPNPGTISPQIATADGTTPAVSDASVIPKKDPSADTSRNRAAVTPSTVPVQPVCEPLKSTSPLPHLKSLGAGG